MAYQTLSVITAQDARQLNASFDTFVSNNSDLVNVFIDGSGTGLYGFSIATVDYTMLVSKVGVSHWKIRFGYDSNKAIGKQFQIYLVGIDSNGTEITDHFLLTGPSTSPLTSSTPGSSQGSVPPQLAKEWLGSWDNLITAGSIPRSFFQNSYGNLLGYDMEMSDFLDAVQYATDPDNYRISFVNHSELATDPIDQPSIPGTFGVMVSAVKDNVAGSPYYNDGGPCPPYPI